MAAMNICVTRRFKNACTFLNAQCECGSDTHQHEINVEYDPDFERVTLHLYFKTWTLNPYKYHSGILGWFEDLWKTTKFRLRVLFFGWAEMHYEFLFNGEEAIQDYINALQHEYDAMIAHKAELKAEHEARKAAKITEPS